MNLTIFFYKHQHGFRKNYSCETQLLQFTNDLFSAIDRGSYIDCVFLDFKKAFDTVSHRLLLLKLRKINIDPQILKWIECFLTNRTQFVRANECDSPTSVVTSGVPQGSVLGPLLFLIYINDLPNHICSSIRLFADDCVIYREISSTNDCLQLQTDLDNVSAWCFDWSMQLNLSKCKLMQVSLSRHPPSLYPYVISNTPLTKVNTYKYLGIHISSNLSWQAHVDYVTNNANRMLGYLRRNFPLAPVSLKLLLYKTLVRTKLEYASAIWDPHLLSLSSSLESIQNRASRFIVSNYSRAASVSSMKANLNLPLLTTRRKIARLSFFHKIFYTNPDIKTDIVSPPSYISPRFDHRLKVAVPNCRTNLRFNSFLPKTASDWNSLPASIASNPDPVSYKTAITCIV